MTHGARITSKTCRRFDILNEPNSLLSLSLSLLDQQDFTNFHNFPGNLKPTEFFKNKIVKKSDFILAKKNFEGKNSFRRGRDESRDDHM